MMTKLVLTFKDLMSILFLALVHELKTKTLLFIHF